MTGPVNAYAPNSLYMATAWNPADAGANGVYQQSPFPAVYSNGNRTLTRNNLGGSNFNPGVRGNTSRGGVAGQKWWLGFRVESMGTSTQPAAQTIGLLDSNPNLFTSDMISNAGTYLIGSLAGSFYMTGQTPNGSLSGGTVVPTDVLYAAWTVGTGVDWYRNSNNVIELSCPVTDLGPWFPFVGFGLSLFDTDATHTGESVSVLGIAATQPLPPPAGFTPWG